ncbi:MAG: LytTR family transcriptional regulator [Bacteroidales bacterium]|nr:LytTR family transcriptional regulator [Bacteroidales bacterium]
MGNWKDHIIKSLKDELSLLFILSVSVFLFILFFEPFPLELQDFNNRLLYITGFGAITFFIASLILIALPTTIPKWFKVSDLKKNLPFILGFLFLTLTATAFAFYIRYVGMVILTFYIMFKVTLVCLLPLIITMFMHKNKLLKQDITTLKKENKSHLLKLKEYENIEIEKEIEILSTNKSDKLVLKCKQIISIKSADNYIEISYLEENILEKKLIRNTLKNIETQLSNQKNFIRCHRTSIVNIIYVESLVRNKNGYSLKMSCFEETIPVSRQYFLQVKDAISDNN